MGAWARSALAALFLTLVTLPSAAQGLRLAVWGSEMRRDGPGLLLRDILRADPQVLSVRDLILRAAPDALLLLQVDHDLRLSALQGFQTLLAEAGHPMPHAFALRPNSGVPSGIDLDGDGRLGTLDDALGWGRFQGAGGMALLSRHPIGADAQDLSGFLWRDLPGSLIPMRDGAPFPSAQAHALQPLSSTGHWVVPLDIAGETLHLLAWHAGPPAFGAVPGRNRARNHDETAFWLHYLDGALPFAPPEGPLVVIGNANMDPEAGDGMRDAIRALLAHPRLQDPVPLGQREADARASRATVIYDPPPDGPGALRSSYILPDAALTVQAAGVIWPEPPARHALVWVDLDWPPR